MMAEDPSFRSNYIEGVGKFQGMRARAFWQEVIALLRGKSAELLSFDDIRARLRLREESYRGLQDIPVEMIKGSVGRYRDFTSTFLPRSNEMRERWSRVYAKVSSMEGVPPIEVFKVGDVYFVRDGNHRVSVARQISAKTIQAHVTELPTDIHLSSGTTLEDLDAAMSYLAFLDESKIKQVRPHLQSIQLSEPSRYPELLGHIYLHAQVMEQLRGGPVEMADASADWYDNVYRPAVTLIRKHDVLNLTGESDRTEADLYLWMVDHLREVRRQYGNESRTRRFSHALVDYLSQKKIAIPRDLINEDDQSVMLSRSQVIEAVRVAREKEAASTADSAEDGAEASDAGDDRE